MTGILKKLELASNIAIIIVVILLASVLIKNYLWQSNSLQSNSKAVRSSPQEIGTGGKINLPEIDWQKNRQTLLFVLSTTCHFCSESGPFYQRLVKEHGTTRLIALMPQSVDEGQKYLKKLEVEIEQIKQVQPSVIGASGTPTLILVDNRGIVIDSWVGKLPADREEEVLLKLE